MKKAVILFTKAPLPGHSKTRLMPYWKAEQAAALQLVLLKDAAAELGKLKKNTDVILAQKRTVSGAFLTVYAFGKITVLLHSPSPFPPHIS